MVADFAANVGAQMAPKMAPFENEIFSPIFTSSNNSNSLEICDCKLSINNQKGIFWHIKKVWKLIGSWIRPQIKQFFVANFDQRACTFFGEKFRSKFWRFFYVKNMIQWFNMVELSIVSQLES